MMTPPNFLNTALLLLLCVDFSVGLAVREHVPRVKTVQGEDGRLECTAEVKPGVRYRTVRWYKIQSNPSPLINGLVVRDLLNGKTKWHFGLKRDVQFLGESRNIILSNLTCSDSAVYKCFLAAPVGEQNREGQILLTVTDCPVKTTVSLTSDTCMVIVATGGLVLALLFFLISHKCLMNTLGQRNKTIEKETLLHAALKPLTKKDLMLIYTLGPKTKTSAMKHILV
ncbi:CD83 antigen [Brachyistius frenatus]|uniref:CD83 antigen n=1 Tax=Brachyistius frenatus TaxID=100188 RepID=UPI0037E8605E